PPAYRHHRALHSFPTRRSSDLLPVQIKGVAFFDFEHGQTGIAPNGIELHPVLDISFTQPSTTALLSSANPSVFAQPITITATVRDRKSTRLNSVTVRSRMPSSA